MFRIDHSTNTSVLPAPEAAGTPGYFENAPPGSGKTPTVLTTDWANGVQEELISFLTFAGIAPDKTNNAQVLAAVISIVGSTAVVGAGAIFGLELTNAPAAPTTKITISAGLTRDSTNTAGMTRATPITKDLTAAWASGDGAGGRDTGALAAGQTWHVHLILNPTSGVVDALFSQSPTAPVLPAGFTKFRRLGAVLTDVAATTIQLFEQVGDFFRLKTRSVDFSAQANSGAASLRRVNVPVGVVVEAEFYFQSNGTIDANTYHSGIFDPGLGTPTMGTSTQWAQVRRLSAKNSAGTNYAYGTVVCRQFTDTSGHIYTLSDDPADVIALGVLGWRDERGKFF